MGPCLASCCIESYDAACCVLCCGWGGDGCGGLAHSLKSSLFYCPSCLIPLFARLAATRINRDIPDKIKYILEEEREALKGGEGIQDLCSHNWNDKDKSPCVRVENMGELVKIEKSINFKCSVVRGKIGYTRGVHVWQIHWPRRDRDKYSAIGVATKDASLFEEIGNYNSSSPPHSLFLDEMGKSNNKTVSTFSWGWNLYSNELSSPCKKKYFPSLHENDDSFSQLTPSKFQLILDLDEKTLAFMAYGKYLGMACKNLNNNKPLYLALSGREIVSGVSVKYLSKYPRF